MKVLIVVGARPNFMKAAPIIAAIHEYNQRISRVPADRYQWPAEPIQYSLVHTGQHYDALMSGVFFRDLNMPMPDVHLGVGSGSHAVQTAEIMKNFEPVLVAQNPDVVVVVGDVNSTAACALVTAKMSSNSANVRPLIAHVEAGLRSFDRSMPEEINRIVTDHLSDVFFVTEESAIQNLRNEGIAPAKIHFVGNTMIDSLLSFQEKAEASPILDRLKLRVHGRNNGKSSSTHPYAVLTLHRPSNVDDRVSFLNIMEGLAELAASHPIVFPAHPRTGRRIEEFGVRLHVEGNGVGIIPEGVGFEAGRGGVILTGPMSYLDFVCLTKHASLVVTDSGGIQEETTCLGIPCVTVRDNTERPVTIEKGTNLIAGTDKEKVKDAIRRQSMRTDFPQRLPDKWDGHAAARIVGVLSDICFKRSMSGQSLIA